MFNVSAVRQTTTALCLLSVLSACATGAGNGAVETSLGAGPEAMWQDGARAIETAEATMTRGEERLVLGRKQVRDGEAKIQSGSQGAASAQTEYEQTAAAVSSNPDRKEQAKALAAIGKQWEAALESIQAGKKLVTQGNANIRRGESEIEEGQALLATGSVLIRNSHRARLGQPLLPMPAN